MAIWSAGGRKEDYIDKEPGVRRLSLTGVRPRRRVALFTLHRHVGADFFVPWCLLEEGMKRSTLILLSGLVSCILVFGGAGAAFAQVKFGVVNVQMCALKSTYGQRMVKTIEREGRGMEATLQRRAKDLQRLRQQLQRQSMVLSMDARVAKDRAYRRQVQAFQELQRQYRDQLRLKQMKLQKDMSKKMMGIVNEIGRRGRYTIIINRAAAPGAPVVLYMDRAINLTAQVISQMNRRYR